MPSNQFYFWPRYDGMVDYAEVAREKLRAGNSLDAVLKTELTKTLAELPADDASSEEATALRRAFLHVLKQAAPELGIDDYFTESMGFNPFLGRTALYITDRGESDPPSVIERTFARSEMIACFDVTRRGKLLRQIRIFACSDYHMQEL